MENKTATNQAGMSAQESFDYFNSLQEDDNRGRFTTVNDITIEINKHFGGGYLVSARFFNGDSVVPWTVPQEFDTFEEARDYAAMLSFDAADYKGGLAPVDKFYGRNVSGVKEEGKSHGEGKRDSTDYKEPTETMYDFMSKRGLTYEEQSAILEYKSSESYKINRSHLGTYIFW